MMTSQLIKSAKIVASLACAAVLAACSGGGGSSMGHVNVSLTDAPACGYDHVYVTVSGVSINDKTDGSGNWVDTDLAAPKKIDLLDLTNGALESLGQAALPAGTYGQLRLVLEPNVQGAATLNNSVVPTGQTDEIALKTPSAQQSGIKVSTREPFTVEPGTLVDLVLDFNACKSVVTNGKSNSSNGNGATGYLLKPVITASPAIVSGSIEGDVATIDAGTSATVAVEGAHVYAEQNGQIVRGTITDSAGHFVLTPLEQSSAVGAYDVVIVNAGSATDIVTGVPVTAEQTTSLVSAESVDGAFDLVASDMGMVSGNVAVAANASLDALQTVGGMDYSIAFTNADATTGDYSFSLPRGAPNIGIYADSATGITLAPDAAATGLYTISATSESGNNQTQSADISATDATGVDFPTLN